MKLNGCTSLFEPNLKDDTQHSSSAQWPHNGGKSLLSACLGWNSSTTSHALKMKSRKILLYLALIQTCLLIALRFECLPPDSAIFLGWYHTCKLLWIKGVSKTLFKCEC